jgi:hypothetical protein
LDRLPEWTEGLQERVEYTTEVYTPDDKYRVGASTHTTIKGAGPIDFQITESREYVMLTYRMIGKKANNTIVTYILEPFEEGTNFTYRMTYVPPGGVLGKFLGRLGSGMLETVSEKSLENLKRILEN